MNTKQRVVIFEGPDGCGKTNISQALSELIEVPYFKNKDEWKNFVNDPSYFINALTYGDPYFLSYLEQTRASVIVDRWYPSEWVYSKIFDRPTNTSVLRRIDERAASVGAKIIIPFRSNYDSVVDQFEDIITPDVLSRVDQVYRDFVKWTECDTLLLNVDDEDLSREILEVREFLRC